MSELSRFFGVVIKMFHDDHNPPHFHAFYGEDDAIFDIRRISLLKGKLPPRALGLVTEWAAMHQNELLDRWQCAQAGEALQGIDPLE
ncbi:MAG TPA: DUF4160 domain-containing protein [Candidatus Hydrogenedentes bacterium]|jgi:hypothetical protein|nr:MAG: hypothetical protein BWX80_00074 [Candidatus Hydrogenedentes bacterium ADurb.Bin101]HQN01000.1 DUF4160 domain-containing protein [Candidatus Hydrogenedentota bacterium]